MSIFHKKPKKEELLYLEWKFENFTYVHMDMDIEKKP